MLKKDLEKLVEKQANTITALKQKLAEAENGQATPRERQYFKCLELSLAYCHNWRIGDKEINDCAGYTKLARIFLDNSIGHING